MQRPPASVSAAQVATDAAPSAHEATAAAPAAGGARRSTRVRKAVLTTAPIVDAASDSSSDSGGGAAATDSDATVDSKDEPEDEDDGDSDQDDSLSADEGVAALTGRRSGGAATQAAAAASDDDRSAGEGTIGDSGTEDEMPEAGGKPLWQQRMRKGGYGTGLNASRARHVAKVSGMSWERFRNGKLPAGAAPDALPARTLSDLTDLLASKWQDTSCWAHCSALARTAQHSTLLQTSASALGPAQTAVPSDVRTVREAWQCGPCQHRASTSGPGRCSPPPATYVRERLRGCGCQGMARTHERNPCATRTHPFSVPLGVARPVESVAATHRPPYVKLSPGRVLEMHWGRPQLLQLCSIRSLPGFVGVQHVQRT